MKKAYDSLFALALAFVFAGCLEPPPDTLDISVSQITIINIPAVFTVGACINVRECANAAACIANGCAHIREERKPFKIYINASNHLNNDQAAEAKGVAWFNDGTLQECGTKHTVTIQLELPNPDYDINEFTRNPSLQNPCFPSAGHWAGRTANFSVKISPQDTSTFGVNEIWVKAGTGGFDIRRSVIDWSLSQAAGGLIDARTSNLVGRREFIDLYQIVTSDYCCINSMSDNALKVNQGTNSGTLIYSITGITPAPGAVFNAPFIPFYTLYYARGNITSGIGAPGIIISAAEAAHAVNDRAAGGIIQNADFSGTIEGLDNGEMYSVIVVARRFGYNTGGVPRNVVLGISSIVQVQAAQ